MSAPYNAFDTVGPVNTTTQSNLPPSRWIVVSNIPREANDNWLRMLFSPVGIVEAVDFHATEGSGSAYLLFATAEQATSALRLNGFNALGIRLQVRTRSMPSVSESSMAVTRRPGSMTAMSSFPASASLSNTSAITSSSATPHARLRDDSGPSHKNLYVLNLPLDATTDQLTALFASYGTVVHCVILAMLDAQARRRGFIDMSTPREAKEAIEGLNGFVWHGYPIEVSYAIVQRSGGPFDQTAGRNIIKRNVPRNRFNTGPRRVPSDSAIDPSVMANLTHQFERLSQPPFSAGADFGLGGTIFDDRDSSAPLGAGMPTSTSPTSAFVGQSTIGGAVVDPFTIFIAGLDPSAIIDDDDFRKALQHYGDITAATLCRDENGTSRGFGIVTFAQQQAASKACEEIHGRVINGRCLAAHKYVYQAASPALGNGNGRASPFLPASHPALTFKGNSDAGLGVGATNHRGFATPLFPHQSTSSTLNNTTMLPQIPLMPMRFNAHTSMPPSVWPTNASVSMPFSSSTGQRLTQDQSAAVNGPGGSQASGFFGMSHLPMPSGAEAYGGTANLRNEAPALFKAHTGSRAIEIKPDPNDAETSKENDKSPKGDADPKSLKKLGEAFIQNSSSKINREAKANGTSQSQNAAPVYSAMQSHGAASGASLAAMTPDEMSDALHASRKSTAAGPQPLNVLTRTPISQVNPWASNGNGVAPNTLGLEGLSPQSVLSATTSPASTIQTPETTRNRDNALIWSSQSQNPNDKMRPWGDVAPSSIGAKHASLTGSALLSLQSDVVEKNSRTSTHSLAPVGHEKTSSPMRVVKNEH